MTDTYKIVAITDRDGNPKTDESSLRRLNLKINTSVYGVQIGRPFVGIYIVELGHPLFGKMLRTSNVVSIDEQEEIKIETLNSVYTLKRV